MAANSIRPRIAVTRKIPQACETRVAKTYDATLNADDRLLTQAEILAMAEGLDGLLVTPMDKIDAKFIGAVPKSIEIISTFSVGYDHIDIPAAKGRGLVITNTPDVLTDATADIAMLLLLGAARGAHWGQKMVLEKTWASWAPTHPLGFDVSGKRLGILGMGRIGQAVAKRAQAFNMELHYHNRSKVAPEKSHGARYHERFEDLLPYCDFLSINSASTPETRNMVNAKAIAAMPDGAIIVNSARGDIIEDDALIAALRGGKLAAAGLDVFRNEPNIDPRFRELENVFLLPHLGSATPGTRIAMGMRAIDNLDAFFRGDRPHDLLT